MRNWLIGIGVVVLLAAVVTAYYLLKPDPNAGDRTKLDVTFTAEEQRVLDTVTVSPQELAAATCDGVPHCWVAVNGVVYDMSSFPSWVRGRHHGVKPGTDATEAFVKSSHARAKLQDLPVVGRLG